MARHYRICAPLTIPSGFTFQCTIASPSISAPLQAMNCQQHRLLPSNSLQHGYQRQGSLRACRTSQKFTRAAAKRHTTCNLDWRTVANDFKEQVQKQKNAAVLGGVGALTAALAVAGTHLQPSREQFTKHIVKNHDQPGVICRTQHSS